MHDDGELLRRWSEGDRDAFGRIYARYRRRLFVYVLSLVGEAETAEDILGEVFLRIARRPGAARGPAERGALAAYLTRIARNRAIDRIRRGRRERTARAEIGRACLLEERGGRGAGGLTALEASELLWRLPPEQREAVVLRIYVGLAFAEIARLMDAPLNTAASRYRYGIEKIRQALQEVSDAARSAL
jgi:RNA polymerase sigma-70 factor (ECF subfamily)